MAPVVAIIAQGEMGAGIGWRLTQHGVTVLTSLSGRGPGSAARAQAAGMKHAVDRELAAADIVLSILPPSEAVSLAQRMATAIRDAGTAPVYADCNAVSPNTVPRIAAPFAGTRARFVDAGIIGGPPSPTYDGPTLYASGADAASLARLNKYGLRVRVLDRPIGAASALKMAYAGITKGMTAVVTAMILAAERTGSSEALFEEFSRIPPFAWLRNQVSGMYPKAYRWVGEMEEIADFAGDDEAARAIYQGVAELYRRMAADHAGEHRKTDVLTRFFQNKGPERP